MQCKLNGQEYNDVLSKTTRDYPKTKREKYDMKQRANKTTTEARKRAAAGNKLLQYYDKLAQYLEYCKFKEPGGEIIE